MINIIRKNHKNSCTSKDSNLNIIVTMSPCGNSNTCWVVCDLKLDSDYLLMNEWPALANGKSILWDFPTCLHILEWSAHMMENYFYYKVYVLLQFFSQSKIHLEVDL